MSSSRKRRPPPLFESPTAAQPVASPDRLPIQGPARRFLLVLVVGSGMASLIYQVVWMRRLVLVFGSTTQATSTVLVAFLGGLAVGAWVWGQVADRRPWDALATYGLVEAGIGLYGLASGWVLRGVEAAYLGLWPVVGGWPGIYAGVQVGLSVAGIGLAAVLMGGTVPLVARVVVGRAGETVSGVGTLYGWNTVGAAVGAGLATYGLLPVVGLGGAVVAAAAGNLVIGASALLLDARRRSGRPAAAAGPGDGAGVPAGAGPVAAVVVLQAFGLSGLAAMAYEVAWARLLALMMGSSVYAFGTLVVVLLAGLGLGSALYARLRLSADHHLPAFAMLELLIAAGALLSLVVVPVLPELVLALHPVVKRAFLLQALEHVVIAASLAFVPSLLLGATFPAVVGSLGGALARMGRTIGTAYGANAVGTVAGAYLAGFVLIPAVGLRATIVIGAAANLLAGVTVLSVARFDRAPARAAVATAAVIAAIVLAVAPAWPRESLVAGGALSAAHYGSVDRLRAENAARRLLFYHDGVSATISVEQVGAHRLFRVNGRTNASTLPSDMLLQLLPAHLAMLWHPAPRRVFILGLGSGITAGAVARYPVERIDIAELERAGPRAARLFEEENRRVLSDSRVRVLAADGRAQLRAAADRYDVIISIPSHLWVAGTAMLYTREFYEIVRARLNSGGLAVQWLQKAGLAPQAFALAVATFRASFPHTTIWTAGPSHALLLGSDVPQRWDLSGIRDRIVQTPGVGDELRRIGIGGPLALFAAFVLGEADVTRLTSGVGSVLTDDRPVIEFTAPRAVFDDTAPVITEGLERLRRSAFPPIDGFDPGRPLDPEVRHLLGVAYAALGRAAPVTSP